MPRRTSIYLDRQGETNLERVRADLAKIRAAADRPPPTTSAVIQHALQLASGSRA